MREIKFRAWDASCNRMNSSLSLGVWRLDPEGKMVNFGDYTQRDYILMQFTGLVDKNGVDIYEGDIVFSDVVREEGILVEFIMGCFYPFINGEDIRIEAHDVEVIGNIYENPDLLENAGG